VREPKTRCRWRAAGGGRQQCSAGGVRRCKPCSGAAAQNANVRVAQAEAQSARRGESERNQNCGARVQKCAVRWREAEKREGFSNRAVVQCKRRVCVTSDESGGVQVCSRCAGVTQKPGEIERKAANRKVL